MEVVELEAVLIQNCEQMAKVETSQEALVMRFGGQFVLKTRGLGSGPRLRRRQREEGNMGLRQGCC